jgi:hypothetical protein
MCPQVFLDNMPKPDNMPSFDQILAAADKLTKLASAAQAAKGAVEKAAGGGAKMYGPAVPAGLKTKGH